MDNKKRANKRGLSVIIGYVLLVAISILLSVIVYRWIKTYVPKEIAECPDGTSISFRYVSYNCTSNILNITLENNGRFSLDGYFIRVSNDTTNSDALPNIDLAADLTGLTQDEKDSILWGNYIKFLSPDNYFKPNSISSTYLFNTSNYGTLNKVEVIPVRREVMENKERIATCSNSKIQERLICS